MVDFIIFYDLNANDFNIYAKKNYFETVPRENLLSPQSQNNFFRINVGKIDFDERNLAVIIKIPIPFYFSHILVYN